MSFSYIVVDDEKATHLLVDYFLNSISDFVKIGDFYNPKEALIFLNENSCDLIFLDIEMPEMNGLDFVNHLKNRIPIIIITAYAQQYAVSGYKYLDKGVIDFLEKPIEQLRLEKAVNRFIKIKMEFSTSSVVMDADFIPTVHVREKDRLITLLVNEILYLNVSGNYVFFNTVEGKRYELCCTMEEALKKLPGNACFQIHRQYAVMLNKVKYYSDNAISLGVDNQGNEIILPLSVRRRRNFLQKVKNHNQSE